MIQITISISAQSAVSLINCNQLSSNKLQQKQKKFYTLILILCDFCIYVIIQYLFSFWHANIATIVTFTLNHSLRIFYTVSILPPSSDFYLPNLLKFVKFKYRQIKNIFVLFLFQQMDPKNKSDEKYGSKNKGM